MILSMEQLRRDYKLYRKKDHEIAARIDILLSYTKFELKYDGDINKDAKNKQLPYGGNPRKKRIEKIGILSAVERKNWLLKLEYFNAEDLSDACRLGDLKVFSSKSDT